MRPYQRAPKQKTVWLVEIPQPALPSLPEPLAAEERGQERPWLADRLEPEDLELARGLLDSLTRREREGLERKARERFGELAPEELEKALVDLVVRRSFGPARLARYGL